MPDGKVAQESRMPASEKPCGKGGPALIEHVNVTTLSARETAGMLVRVFDWSVRWEGAAMSGGQSIHVGTDDSYIALYTPPAGAEPATGVGQPNHIGLIVNDLAVADERLQAEGYTTYNHASYAPGRRFYFRDKGGVEFEVVSYS
jgi:predicted enzyme related to lactoylglutathione lyase